MVFNHSSTDPYLAEAINHGIENKHFPDCLKIVKINPVFKKGKTDDPLIIDR